MLEFCILMFFLIKYPKYCAAICQSWVSFIFFYCLKCQKSFRHSKFVKNDDKSDFVQTGLKAVDLVTHMTFH